MIFKFLDSLGSTTGGTQFLALYLEITHDTVQGIICGTRDQTYMRCSQGKHPTCCTDSLALFT